MKAALPIVFAILTGLFWGSYGPLLAPARTYLKSPFTPYLMIGIAYLVWGIGGGIIGMLYKGDSFTGLNTYGLSWGFAAGTVGAFGALALTLAMFMGGTAMPQVVMPIVFGTAVTVAAIIGAIQVQKYPPPMIGGIALIAMGILIVTYYQPHAHPPKKPASVSQT